MKWKSPHRFYKIEISHQKNSCEAKVNKNYKQKNKSYNINKEFNNPKQISKDMSLNQKTLTKLKLTKSIKQLKRTKKLIQINLILNRKKIR